MRNRDRDVDGRRDFGGLLCVFADVWVSEESSRVERTLGRFPRICWWWTRLHRTISQRLRLDMRTEL